MITFTRLKYLSFAHSAIYLGAARSCGCSDGPEGAADPSSAGLHGIGWIVMSLLCIVAVRLRVIPLWLAVMVAVVGGVGPFAGSIGFIVCETTRCTAGTAAWNAVWSKASDGGQHHGRSDHAADG